MGAVLALAKAELTMLLRNRSAALNAVAIPLGLGVVWILTRPPGGAASLGAAFQLTTLAAMTVTATSTITLVARRDRHVLQRWRASGAGALSILGGTLLPLCGLLAVQAAILFSAMSYATGSLPERPVLLAMAVLLASWLAAALGVITAAFTRSADSANMTSFPALAAFFGGALWTASTQSGDATWAMLATGGGAVTELVRIAWAGLPEGSSVITASAPPVAVLLFLITFISGAAARLFRWTARN